MSGPIKDKPCDEWANKLSQIDQLPPADQAALTEHVKSCAPCSAALAQYRIMHEYLHRSLAAEPLAEMPSLGRQLPRRSFRLPTLVAFLPAMGIALLVGLLFLVLGQLIAQIIAHVPGTPLVWTMPLTPLATALILALFVVTREALPAWNDQATRSYARSQPSRPSMPQMDRPGGVKRVAESSPPLLQRGRRGWHYRGLLLIVILSLLAVSASSLAILALNPSLIHTNATPGAPVQSAEPTGISVDGSQAFDVTRTNGDLKLAAAARIRAHDVPGAEVLWQQALAVDSGDAETRIYQEDQRVLASHHPYFTLVLGTILGKGYLSGGRDDLQGAYIAQREYNDQVNQVTGNARPLLRLMVASSTFDTVSPAQVAQQVVEAARQDSTIKGVMGWPTTASAQASLPILAAAHIPMLSASASGDTLTGQSPYFFRLSPTNTFQEEFAARYVKNVLHAKRVVLFEDPNDPFSRTLADAFVKYFSDADHTIIMQANYVKGHPEALPPLVKQALTQHPDLLYFSGYASDASMVLKNLPACTPNSCLLVMGGEAFYLQADYALNDLANYTRLRFTSFAFPGLWRIQHREQPRFFKDYAQTFDPNGQYRAGTYGYNQPEGHTILSYDAIQVLLYASNTLPSRFTPAELRQALTRIAPAQPFQGVSGPIAFGPNGDNTLGKVMVLAGDTHSSPDGNIRLDYGEEVP